VIDLTRLNVRDFFDAAARDVPDQPFLIWQDEPISYAAFGERAERAANAWTRLGIEKGDRVVFMVDNSPAFLESWLGLARIGGILSAVNTGFTADEVTGQVVHSDPSLVLVSAAHAEVMAEVARRIPGLRVLHLGPHDRFEDFAARVDGAEPITPPVELHGDDVISLIYTSGTTGKPKAVMQTHRAFVLTGQAYPTWLDIRAGDRQYVCLPYFHINSQAYSTMGAIGARATIVLVPKFSASRFWADVRRHHVTHFNFIGAMTVILSRAQEAADDGDNDVRVAYGGTKLPYELQMDVERRFGLRIISGFGMSETTLGMIEDVHGYRRPGSIGKPRQHPDPAVPRNEARLVDDAGAEVAPGEVGELLLRNPTMALGYFRDPERTAETFRDGWLHTGDLLRRDDEGFHFFVDRKKDVIRRRGENISSVEVERVLAEHPAVRYAAIVGVPSELTDEEVLAFVVPQPASTVEPAELLAFARERLARFKVPRYVRVVDDLPRTGSHKVRKEILREDWRQPGLYDAEAEEAATGAARAETGEPARG
jgi:crotonobetaine/carnitine-CoA ligase